MAWGLDKAILKRIWDAVAGNAGHLNQNQFIQCLYLMDAAKRGVPPPPRLPPGQFPPLAPGAVLPPLAIGGISAGPTGATAATAGGGGFGSTEGMGPGAVAGPSGAVALSSASSSATATPAGSFSGGQAAAIASITGFSGRR